MNAWFGICMVLLVLCGLFVYMGFMQSSAFVETMTAICQETGPKSEGLQKACDTFWEQMEKT